MVRDVVVARKFRPKRVSKAELYCQSLRALVGNRSSKDRLRKTRCLPVRIII